MITLFFATLRLNVQVFATCERDVIFGELYSVTQFFDVING